MTIQAALVGRRGAPFIARRAALSKRQGRVVTGEQVGVEQDRNEEPCGVVLAPTEGRMSLPLI